MNKLVLQASNFVRYRVPINVKDGDLIDSGTCLGSWYDDAKDRLLLSDVAGGVAIIPVNKPSAFALGDLINVRLDDLTTLESTIASIQSTTITLNDVLPSQASAGGRVSRRYSGGLVLVPYGAPAVGDLDWGFGIGHDPSQQVGLFRGMVIRFELSLDDGLGTIGFQWFNSKVVAPR